MSLTFLAKSSAYSWKMSFDGHVLCQRMLIGALRLDDARRGNGGRAVATRAGLQKFATGDRTGLLLTHWLPPP